MRERSGWEEWIRAMEESQERACVECAASHNHTMQEALHCDNFSVGCPDCPFKKEEQ